jgi:endogenous inhibitor of DNA gyrase (YacG/DUF329 family)
MYYKQICKECDKNYKSNGANSRYCSKECRQIARSKEHKYIKCSNCESQVRYFPNSEHKNKTNIFCSNKCQGDWMSKNSKELNLPIRALNMRKSWSEESWKKSIETRKKNGNIIASHNWKQYWKKCNYLTKKIRSKMLENWDGFDYIDGEYIKDNLNLHFTHTNYPTLDHIKPRSICFKEGLTPEEATKPENLKWTKRVNNSSKSNKYG